MVDSRQKGRTAELKCRDELRKLTGLMWERTPMSGALDAKHMMKGDIYVPQVDTIYCIEVKHYKDDHVDTKLITGKNPMLLTWWAQAVREAGQMNKEPLLVFKHDRSKWFVAFKDWDIAMAVQDKGCRLLQLYPEDLYIGLLVDFCAEAEFV
jgi:hypothetical protein